MQTGKLGAKDQTVVALIITLKRHVHVLIPEICEFYIVKKKDYHIKNTCMIILGISRGGADYGLSP